MTTTYAEQTRVQTFEPELKPDETLEPQATALTQSIGSQLVPISFEVIGADSHHHTHNQYAYAAHLLFDTMDPDFVSITKPEPDEYSPNDCFDIAAEHGDKSKIVPVIDAIPLITKEDHLILLADINSYRERGIEKILIRPPKATESIYELPTVRPTITNFISHIRELGQFSSIGVIINSGKTFTAKTMSENYDQTAQELAGSDFGITQSLPNPEPYVELVKAMRARKVTAPILPGIKPSRRYGAIEADPPTQRPATLMTYLISMGADLIKQHNAPGLHIYTDNNVRAAQRLAQGVEHAIANL
jgi:5,10-methylenetetrahydrofolate reductase